MTKNDFLDRLHDKDFTGLFTECGWNAPTSTKSFTVVTGETSFDVREVAQKGVRIYTCAVDAFPPSSLRRTLDAKLRKFSHAYFIIFTLKGEEFHHQWMVPVDAVDKRRLVVAEYRDDTHAAPLYDKVNGLTFGLEDTSSVIDVVAKVNALFTQNAKVVTDSFYKGFRKQHDAFVKGIQGIVDAGDRNWYASVMLNRLMFCYFIQKKGFFMDKYGNPDVDYLQHHLQAVVDKKGPDQFYGTFYRGFLRGLFMDGLDSSKRSKAFVEKYGMIPYLNGGMFEIHSLEKANKDLDVPDKVFVSLFKFFDEWNWHLDDRIERDGRDINPDVLGYIFEQYINDRAQMGAYYTKEDITEYIGRNCIMPWLLSATAKKSPEVFKSDGLAWQTLRTSGDKYIFPAVKKGVDLPLPPQIENGVAVEPQSTLRKRRVGWNAPASAEYALPTEIWRETVSRRQRCAEVRSKIASGEIRDVNDFITYNLDIRAFAEDLIRDTTDNLFVKHFYDALRNVTILDPTCGSGAFLFAALNILEPLYEACLDRMEEFNAKNPRLFKDELNEIKAKYRSNRQYFIYKSIILRNLYGVDIMHEATEIARLRLFLKMVAVVEANPAEANLGLDPLPDIDFNIRCGNTLVGFANPQGVKDAILPPDQLQLDLEAYQKVETKAADIADLYERFKSLQQVSEDSAEFCEAKKELNKRLAALNDELDRAMASRLYDINPDTLRGNKEFQEWKRKTQPFHWYSEFYGITVANGGFDVIIGNPPYVVYNEAECGYRITGMKTLACQDLYAFTMERSAAVNSRDGTLGMIVPISIGSTDGFLPLRKLLMSKQGGLWVSSYSMRPGKLFEGVDKHLSIVISSRLGNDNGANLFTAKYHRWGSEARENLFAGIQYCLISNDICFMDAWPKISTLIEKSILLKLRGQEAISKYFVQDSRYIVYHTRKLRYFVQFLDRAPIIYNADGSIRETSELKEIHCGTAKERDEAIATFLSTLFFWVFISFSDCRNLNKREEAAFPHVLGSTLSEALAQKGKSLLKNLQQNSYFTEANYKKYGQLKMQTFQPRLSKPIIDEIDELLAKHYGFTEEELDFIINYDIKYRMGDKLNEGE